jgi:cation:H+ antiporter
MLFVAGFILCAAVIFISGKRLAFYGDLLADKTGLSKGWIGLLLMASVTSLPELMVGISSSAIVESPDLAVGDVIGSCAFNLGILAMLDAFIPKHRPLLGVVSTAHILNAGLGIILVSLVGFALFLPNDIYITSWIGLSSVVFIVIYFVSVVIMYLNEKKYAGTHTVEASVDGKKENLSLKNVVTRYILLAAVIIAAALALPYFAEHIARISGLETSFVGTFFLAASTSMPEIAVSVAAVRAGSVDMAVGNLLGSNIFNVFILALDDIFYRKGLLLQDAADKHMISVLSVIIMSAVVVIGLSYHANGKRFLLAWDAVLIFLIYIINLMLLAVL